MNCPEPSTLQALLARALPPSEEETLWRHIDACVSCGGLLAAVARSSEATTAEEGERLAPTADGKARQARSDGEELLDLGTRVGRYVIESFIAAGGFGNVYAAHDPELGRRVALKLLRASASGSQADARFLREARAMARISHPNVVAVHDVGLWSGRVFVAMELVEGTDLKVWRVLKPRRVGEIVDVFRAAGQGLAAAHAAGLIHRDFKPQNVLISDQGRVRVTDFGLARAADLGLQPASSTERPQPDDAITREGLVAGTPAYMAPEQLRAEHLDARTDQFAFCVALYEALYGERPFGGEEHERLARIGGGQLPAAPAGSTVPASLRAIVQRGLAANAKDRWPTMAALLDALGRDRSRPYRAAAWVAFGVLAVLATAAAGDALLRARHSAAARESFAATRASVDRTLRLRYDAFGALADLSTQLPALRQVAASRDVSDFGLGESPRDEERFKVLHDSLRDADQGGWRTVIERGGIAIADYKGRLCWSSARPDAWGLDLRAVPVIDEAYDPNKSGGAAQVLSASNPALLHSGVWADDGKNALVVIFARGMVLGGVPQGVFVQILTADRLLAEVATDPSSALALVTARGEAQGDVPPAVLAASLSGSAAVAEVSVQGRPWLLQRHVLPAVDEAALVVARPADVGLAGLFPHAREVLAALGSVALVVLGWCVFRVRSVAAGMASAR